MARSFDRFDLLPDPLLVFIVSFLPFREAARTSILSKRWLHIWEQTPNIEFNELFFAKLNRPHYLRVAQRRIFLCFISFFIDNYEGSIVDKFSLKLSNPEDDRDIIERCIAFATKRGVKELGLDFSDPFWEEDHEDLDEKLTYIYDEDKFSLKLSNPEDDDDVIERCIAFATKRWVKELEDDDDSEPDWDDDEFNKQEALVDLPTQVYEHESLQSLKLFSCGFLESGLIKLHALKEVSLGWMEVPQTAITALLSNCKLIESLSLKSCWNESSEFEICGEELRLSKLVVDKCYFQSEVHKVKAPKLSYFKYSGAVNLFEIECASLEEADLDFALEIENEGNSYLCILVKGLFPVRILTRCSYVLKILHTGEEPLRIESDINVRHLIMKTDLEDLELLGISFLLNSCQMLECVTFEVGLGRSLLEEVDESPFNIDYQRAWMDHARVFECLKSTLKVVEMNNFTGTANGLLVLYNLIRFGKVLEKVKINVKKGEVDGDSGSMAFYHAIEEFLRMVPSASKDLEISISY